MDRNREARRASIVGSNGLNRRRHRTSSLRDSPDEDGVPELQESVRLRDRVKKDRDRDRERERDRERGRERDRERDLRERSSRSKRRRAEKLTTNREDIGGDETTEESVNDDEDEEEEDNTSAASSVRQLTPAMGSISNHHHHGHVSNRHHSHITSYSQQHHSNTASNMTSNNHHLQHRKSFPSSKVFRASPVWKSGDEMIGVSVPRKARSACTKRSHDWASSSSNNNSGGGVAGGEQTLRQASSSPVRQGLVSTSALAAASLSPSSTNVSIRKKLKPSVNGTGPTPRPPNVSSKPSSSNPGELEIEIAEVLYGLMTQSQGPSSKKEESREVNRPNGDAKSRHSSPISNSTSTINPSLGPTSSPLSAVAPKRKRPRQIPENPSSSGARSSPMSGKPEPDQTPKSESSSPCLERTSGAAAENGYDMGGNSVNSQGPPAEPREPMAPESTKLNLGLKPGDEESKESRDFAPKEDVSPPKEKEYAAVGTEDSSNKDSPSTATTAVADTMIKANSVVADVENHKEEKLEIDLMAPPPQVKSSPEREIMTDLSAAAEDQKPVLSAVDSDLRQLALKDNEDDEAKSGKEQSANAAAEEKKCKGTGDEAESHEAAENKAMDINLQVDFVKTERDGTAGVDATGNKLPVQPQQHRHQPQQKIPLKATKEEPLPEKSGRPTTSLPLSMPMASWPGDLPPVGYVAPPLQGVVSMDGSTMTPASVQPLCSQPRPKRCATHCHIARNIYSHQQFTKMSHFWTAPTGSAPLFGSKPCNVNVTPPSDLQGNVCVRGVNNADDKGQSLASTPNNGGKEKGSQPASISDSAQRKQQFVIQQPVPPVAAPSNLLGPAFFFPLNQQQPAVAARPGAPRPSATGASSSSTSGSAGSSSSVAAGPAAAMSFNYPNITANETQYLAILQNNAYPFPMPAVGAPPNYRGATAQAMPLFNGPPFYSSQMIHPSQLQHPQPPPSTQTQQLLQNQQNASASGGSSLSQKHLHGQQPRPQSSVAVGSGSANMQNFASPKNLQSQQLQQSHNQYVHSSRPKQLEGEVGSEDSPTADSRGSRASVNVYGTSFAMPIHPQNYDLLTPAALAGAPATSGSSNQTEKKVHQLQQQGSKSGVESLTQQSFAMSFGPINGTTTGPGIDISSMAQNHAMLNNSPEGTRQNVQMMAAATAQVAPKNFRISEDGKSGSVDSSATDDERKSLSGKALGGVGQSITFTRSDLAEGPAVSIPPNTLASGPSRSSRSRTNNAAVGTINVSTAHIHAQMQQHHLMQLKQQQLGASPGSRSKAPATSNGSLYPEHLNSSSAMAAKFPNTLSGFPQSLVQSNSSSPVQSPQWKSSNRTPTSPAPSSLGSSKGTMLKNIPQQHSRSQPQMHTQISFEGNQNPSVSPGQANPSSNQSSSSMLVGSPATSSISKGASGSPRTTTHATTTSKMGQAPMLSSQQSKNLPSITGHKSPSILGNTHISSSSSSNVAKAQVQQQPQQQLPKAMQQAHLFFSTPYTHSQSLHSAGISSTTSSPGGHYLQRRRPDQQQQAPVALATPSTGVLSLCPPVTLSGTSTNDPAKAIAAATSNIKGGGLSSQGIIQTSQFAGQSVGPIIPAGFSYVHSVPAAVQVKTAEQKQPAGHDNLHTWQSEKK